MEKFVHLKAVAAPLLRVNIDTDVIIPSREMKGVSKTGLSVGMFANWRYTDVANRVANPEFVLNQPAYAKAQILLSGSNFGCGSSREHAVWALQDYGFKVVISSRFADIFRGNSGKAGLLTALVDQDTVEQLWALIEADPTTAVTVDLEAQTVSAGDLVAPFDVDPYVRWRLLQGLDDIGITLQKDDAIAAFESSRPVYSPTTIG